MKAAAQERHAADNLFHNRPMKKVPKRLIPGD